VPPEVVEGGDLLAVYGPARVFVGSDLERFLAQELRRKDI
jgi:hypothetical protein